MDLRWLVQEGYVTEFADGRLFTPPPMAEARVKAAESSEGEEHDLESFPEVPVSTDPTVQPPAAGSEAPPSAPPSDDAIPASEPANAPEPSSGEATPALDPEKTGMPPASETDSPPTAASETESPGTG